MFFPKQKTYKKGERGRQQRYYLGWWHRGEPVLGSKLYDIYSLDRVVGDIWLIEWNSLCQGKDTFKLVNNKIRVTWCIQEIFSHPFLKVIEWHHYIFIKMEHLYIDEGVYLLYDHAKLFLQLIKAIFILHSQSDTWSVVSMK